MQYGYIKRIDTISIRCCHCSVTTHLNSQLYSLNIVRHPYFNVQKTVDSFLSFEQTIGVNFLWKKYIKNRYTNITNKNWTWGQKRKIKENMNQMIKDKEERRIHRERKNPSIDMITNNGNVILQIIVVRCNTIRQKTAEKLRLFLSYIGFVYINSMEFQFYTSNYYFPALCLFLS